MIWQATRHRNPFFKALQAIIQMKRIFFNDYNIIKLMKKHLEAHYTV